MSDSGSSSNDCAQKQAIAFGQRVKQTVPNDHLNNSISYDEVTFHNPLCDSRFKKVPVTVIYSQGPHLGKPPDLAVKAQSQSPQSGNQSEIKIVQVWTKAVEKDSNSVDNSHQHSNLLEQAGQIMPADNSSNNDVSQTVQTQESPVHSETVAIEANWEERAHINKYVSNSSEKTTGNKATRLERQRQRQKERQRQRRKDPAYVERERKRQKERQRERRKDPAYVERERKRKRERYQTDSAYAERERERQRELYKDPVYAQRQRERKKERYETDPGYAGRQKERQRNQRKRYQADPGYAGRQRKSKKQCCQSVNSAKTQVISR